MMIVRRTQQGYVMIISMIILLLLSMVIGSMLSTRDIEQKNSASAKTKNHATIEAENTQKSIEKYLSQKIYPETPISDVSSVVAKVSSNNFFVWDTPALKSIASQGVALKSDAWWETYAISAQVIDANYNLNGSTYKPRFIIEETQKPFIESDAMLPDGTPGRVKTYYYRITVRSGEANARTTLESIVKKDYVL